MSAARTGEAVLARHEHLPPRAAAAANVMRMVDDPDASVQQLAHAIAPDPIFAARLLRVANSAYYGLGGRVGTLPFAVSVVGFQTVRSLAVAAAAGLDDPTAAPPDFWIAAATAATAAELVAPSLQAHPGDAFSLGLLHTLGAAFLHQHAPLPQLCLPFPEDAGVLEDGEFARYGITHAAAGAHVLRAWQFPEEMCLLIQRHHEPPLEDAVPLERTLHVARALAHRLLRYGPAGEDGGPVTDERVAWLSQGRLGAGDLTPLLERVQAKAEGLVEGLRPQR